MQLFYNQYFFQWWRLSTKWPYYPWSRRPTASYVESRCCTSKYGPKHVLCLMSTLVDSAPNEMTRDKQH